MVLFVWLVCLLVFIFIIVGFLFVVLFYEADLSKWLEVAIGFLSGLLLHSWDLSSSGCSSSIRVPWLPGFLPGKSLVSQLELGLPGSQFCPLIR